MAQGAWPRFSAVQCFTLATGIAVVRWLLMTLVSALIAIMLTRGLHGLSLAILISWWPCVHAQSSEAPASGQALLGAAVGGLGAGVGVYWGAWIVETGGTWALYQWAMNIGLCALALAGGLLWLLSKPAQIGSS